MTDESKHRGVFERPKGSGIFWIHYYENGRRHRERVGKKSLAIKRYSIRKAEILEGRYFAPRQSHLVEDLFELVRQDYRANKKNLEPVETSWKRLKGTFARVNAERITTDDLQAYIIKQLRTGYSPASLNRDFAYLNRSLNLARRSTPPKIQRLPVFPPRLREAPPRSGFIEEDQYQKLILYSWEPWMKCFIAIAYAYGFRKSEILGLRVSNVERDFIRLHAGTTKNREGRIAPLTAEVRKYLGPCMRRKRPSDFLITRQDGRVRDFRGTWATLIEGAELPGLLIHDLRRSAVRQLIRHGVSERVAMAISGHKTRSVFDRYNLTSETDIMEAGKKLESMNPTATTTATSGRRQRPAASEQHRKYKKLVDLRRAS